MLTRYLDYNSLRILPAINSVVEYMCNKLLQYSLPCVIVICTGSTSKNNPQENFDISIIVADFSTRFAVRTDENSISILSSSSLYSPKEHSVTNSELDSRAGQHGSKKATLIVAREEKIKYT